MDQSEAVCRLKFRIPGSDAAGVGTAVGIAEETYWSD